MASDQMWDILMQIGLTDLVQNFQKENISPEIVHLLSEHEMQVLGLRNKVDMVSYVLHV